MQSLWRRLGWVLIAGVGLVGCPAQKPVERVKAPTPARVEAPQDIEWRKSQTGVGFRLSNADPAPPPERTIAATEPLSVARIEQLMRALPKFGAPAEKKKFALRSKSLPAPRPGQTIKTPFPPANQQTRPALRPGANSSLSVSRFAPEGDVKLAPNLSVTFSQPMVAITSLAELKKLKPPVQLSPQPPGEWRWLGTQTLLFEPDERFPMATDYQVRVPAGTPAVSGAKLAQSKEFEFRTPALKLEQHIPTGYHVEDLDAVVFLGFDQRINAQQLTPFVELKAHNELVQLRPATPDEILENKSVRRAVEAAEEGRYLVLAPTEPLQKNTSYQLTLGAGAPSAEGPKTTSQAQSFSFFTYGPMSLQGISCYWSDECPPLTPWHLRFSNEIDRSSFKKEMVEVDPPLEGMKLRVSGPSLMITGRSKGKTTYTIRVKGPLKDKYGQVLQQPAQVTQKVGSAEPTLFSEQQTMSILDPASQPKLNVYSVNHPRLRVKLYQVTPQEYQRYYEWRRDWDSDQKLTKPPGKLVYSRVVATRKAADELVETSVDLSPALKDGVGQVLAIVEPTTPPKRDRWGGINREWVRTWLQVTKLGLRAFSDAEEVHGWVSDLATGAPLENVELGLLGRSDTKKTGADGMSKLALTNVGKMLYARRGSDLVMAPRSTYYWNDDSITRQAPSDALRWFVFDDRKLYKPGEKVNLKGWLRVSGQGKGGDIRTLPDFNRNRVTYTATDARGNEIGKGSASVDSAGSFHFSFDLANNVNLGNGRIHLVVEGPARAQSNAAHYHSFQIEEFRRPEYEVTAQVSEGPHSVGKHAIATVNAAYFAGGGLVGADVEWQVNSQDAHFQPPKHADFHFGKAPNWWWDRDEPSEPEKFTAKTNSHGSHRLRIDLDALEPAFTRRLDLQAHVTDVNRQSWVARNHLLVHPADVYLGLRLPQAFVKAGQALHVQTKVADLDGVLVSDRPIQLTLSRIESDYDGEEWVERQLDPQTCELTSGADIGDCRFETKQAGRHRLSGVVTDSYGRPSATQLNLWVLGESSTVNERLESGRVEIIADKDEYQAGDTAKLLVMAPFAPAEALLTLRRQGLVEVRRLTFTAPTQLLEVKIDGKYTPNIFARVDLVGADVRENEAGDPDPSLPKRPAFAVGSVNLSVPPVDRTLDIAIAPEAKFLKPGAHARIGFDVKDVQGEPVKGARLAVVVVDESVLALTGYQLPDPLEVFYARRPDGVQEFETRLHVVLDKPALERFRLEPKDQANFDALGRGRPRTRLSAKMRPARIASAELAEAEGAQFGMIGAPAPAMAPEPQAERKAEKAPDVPKEFSVRTDFRALAAFLPNVTTDATGHAQVSFKLPDSLTRYRVMVVASSGHNQFGSEEEAVTARLPLMVRPSPPRFLNFGDTFELPVVLQNQSNQEQTVDVVARTANLDLTGSAGLRVKVPANDRVEVRFPAAAGAPGSARFQVGASSKAGADASEHELPIWSPATTEAFATYGQVDEGAVAQRVRVPRDAVPDFGELEITTSSTALQGLTDALIYLVQYPYECNEQIASRVLAIAGLKDVLSAFQAEGLPSEQALNASIKKDIARLKDRQHYRGGWDFWRRDRIPNPYVSAHVTHALTRARDKGYPVPKYMLDKAFAYLDRVHEHIPSWYSQQSRWFIEAYAVYVRNRGGQRDVAELKRLLKDARTVTALPLEALGWLLPVMGDDPEFANQREQIRRHLANRITETASHAHFATSYADGAHVLMHSDRRADGILLEAMIEDEPKNDVIPKLVTGLLAQRKRGRWYNTQENAFVLLALDRYFNTYEKLTPDFVARAWLGKDYALEHQFRGRSVDRQHVDIPMQALQKYGKGTDLLLQKQGDGRLYYRIGMNYAPKSLWLPPAEAGFTVSRQYEAVDDETDVQRDENGVWRIKAGATVRVRVNLVAPARRYHVALVDPLPAGFEASNPALATTGDLPRDPKAQSAGAPWWWSRPWYEHQNMRDERQEAFASLLWAGVYDFSYIARATTLGNYVVPPAKAEEMYAPETFGRSASDRVVVY